ncbi:MAG: transposase [Actinomycetota bacterium]
MPTATFCSVIGVPERTWRRWQAKARADQSAKGPWPKPVREIAKATIVAHAEKHVAWGHRTIWAMTRRDGVQASPSTVLRALRDENLLQSADYQRERRQLAAARKAAFLVPPTRPNHVWQLDFSDFETIAGGTWRIAGCRDYWSKFEPPWHISPTANHMDAIEAVELALAEFERLFGHPLVDDCPVDVETGEILPVVTLVTDNGGPFRAFRFETFISQHPELRHVRTRVRSPGQNGSRERGFESLKYERLYLEEIHDGLDLARHAEAYRIEYNTIRPHEALAWNSPLDVHLGLVDPSTPNFPEAEILPTP